MKDEMISKKKFQPGDKFILEIGEKRMALDEYEIVGTDLWVWGSLLEKLTPYEPDHNAEVSKKVGDDLIRRHGVSAWLYNLGYPKLADIVMNEQRFPPAQPEQRWISCSERLPENKSYVLTTIYVPGRQPHARSGWFEDGLFMNDNGDTWKSTDREVCAWMPLPAPYHEESKSDE